MVESPRTRNASATREAILDAATQLFLRDGYDNAGLRAIAADAGIDPALINRYFGSKRQLFGEVLNSAGKNPVHLFEGERERCGERLAEALAACTDDQPRQLTFLGLVVGTSGSPEASEMASAHIERNFIGPVSRWLGGRGAQGRARLLCSLLMGSVIMNNIKPRSPADHRLLAEQVQRIIDG